jgi:lipid-A-disaccharide synthase
VSETRAVPEYIGANCRPGPIAQAVVKVLETPEAQEAAMALAMQRLGQGGEAPGLRAAKAVLDGITRN